MTLTQPELVIAAEPHPQVLSPTALRVAAVASMSAGLVHVAAARSHSGERSIAVCFALGAVAQIGWAVLALARPNPLVRWLGIALGLGAAGFWFVTHTSGINGIGAMGVKESIGFPDAVAAALAFGAAIAAFGAGLARHERPARHGVTSLAAVAALALAAPAMSGGHTHAASHDRTTSAAAPGVATRGPADDGHPHATEASSAVPGAPTTVHIDDDHAHWPSPVPAGAAVLAVNPHAMGQTVAQKERADGLLRDTKFVMERFPDEASVQAAGFRSIGDGISGFEHFVNTDYLTDENELDPTRPESIVMEVTAGTKRVVSAMYILDRGTTMDQIPDAVGPPAMWHDHQNLCWDETGTRLAGRVVNGVCKPGGTMQPTAPMLHVWVVDNPCGPFSGTEEFSGKCTDHIARHAKAVAPG
jgi:hypothetical protein